MQGTVHRINGPRGFGFIRPSGDRGQGDHFFHCRDLVDIAFTEEIVGQRVEFDSETSPKGLAAKNVRPASN